MTPKLYWDSNGRERVVNSEAEEKDALSLGWSPDPPGVLRSDTHEAVAAAKPYLSDAEVARTAGIIDAKNPPPVVAPIVEPDTATVVEAEPVSFSLPPKSKR